MNDNAIMIARNYGKIIINTKEIMDKKNINRNALSHLAGIRFEVADRWYTGKIERIDIDILARICFVLECEPKDIIKYEP